MAPPVPHPVFARPLPLVLGHRGAPREAPENTLPSFLRALASGADGVELDVQLSRDGVPVVIHDAALERTTDGRGPVGARTLDQLRALDAGGWFDPAFAGTPIPTLDEVLAVLPAQAVVNVELKGTRPRDDGLAAAVVAAIRRHGAEGRVIVSSFNPVLLRRVRALAPELCRGLLTMPGLPRPLARAWLAPWVQPHAVHPRRDMVTDPWLARWRRRGWAVVAWDARPEDTLALAAAGVAAIIADDPAGVRARLAAVAGEPRTPAR